ncbi:MAG TPA: TIR domain-containing protein [Longimicrobium sp.]|nr:TIR domain-containing protein [Longimicrobium sp.]
MSKLKVFICHASSDKPAARELYQRLKAEGFEPWLDEEDLLPGQNWKRVIPRAVAESHVVVVCLSNTAVTKQGFVQKEIGYALDVASEQPEDTIFIIPVRLEECGVPGRLSEWHWVNLYEPRGYEHLLRALRHRAESLPGGQANDATATAPPARVPEPSWPPPVEPAPSAAVGLPARPAVKEPAPRVVPQQPPRVQVPVAATPAAGNEGYGIALGCNLLWHNDTPFMVEVEISSYVDDPHALGATLVFHSLDYSALSGSEESLSRWRLDVDDDLERDERAPLKEQFKSIALQLSRLPEARLRDYLLEAFEASHDE